MLPASSCPSASEDCELQRLRIAEQRLRLADADDAGTTTAASYAMLLGTQQILNATMLNAPEPAPDAGAKGVWMLRAPLPRSQHLSLPPCNTKQHEATASVYRPRAGRRHLAGGDQSGVPHAHEPRRTPNVRLHAHERTLSIVYRVTSSGRRRSTRHTARSWIAMRVRSMTRSCGGTGRRRRPCGASHVSGFMSYISIFTGSFADDEAAAQISASAPVRCGQWYYPAQSTRNDLQHKVGYSRPAGRVSQRCRGAGWVAAEHRGAAGGGGARVPSNGTCTATAIQGAVNILAHAGMGRGRLWTLGCCLWRHC